jgi:predicted ATPase/DNA-binding SARP family transcriptional activator/DNA-binding CsgD family transcriptional regulator
MSQHRRRQAWVDNGSTNTNVREPEVLRIALLGGFRVSVGTRTIEEDAWHLRKAANLVKLLALAPGHLLHREQAMDALWPDLARRAASNNLRQVLHAARRVLDPVVGSRYLASDNGSLILGQEGLLWVDAEAFGEAAIAARRAKIPSAYEVAIEQYAGELLPGDYEEAWTQDRREELRRLYLTLLLDLATLYEEREEYERGIGVLRRALCEDPSREETHADLMRQYAHCGRRREAVLQYELLVETLTREPEAETRRLYERIRAGDFPQGSAGADWRELEAAAGRHNLPASSTSFVGREREIAEARRMLSMTRLLTLTGAGGSGKTRLAVEAARGLAGAYPDGVWMAEVAPLSEPGLVPQALAHALGIREQPGRPLLGTIIQALRSKELLLVMDNCEHLIQASASLAEGLLSSCPHLRILATSREPLGIGGEAVRQVGPLSLPETSNGQSTAESLMRCEAVRLFVERARVTVPDFGLTEGNAGAVVRVCRRLDGMPLAIELAAAQLGDLAVEQVAGRLEGSLDLLQSNSRTVEPKQQTLRATLDWSHELLEEPEKRLFARLSVFAGGWSLEAAEAVFSGEGIEGEGVLDPLSRLVDKSLVVAEPSGRGETRYRLLEPVRQYAREKLQSGREADRVRRQHAEWCLRFAEDAEKGSSGPGFQGWLELLETEHDNLRAALGWSLEGSDAELGLRLAGALWLFWFTQGYSSEGWGWLERGISLGGTKAARAKALNGAGWIALFLGESETAKRLLQESVILYKGLQDEEGLASSLNFLGFVALLGGRTDIPVAPLLEEALALKPRIKNRSTIANTLVFAALDALLLRGDWDESVALHDEALMLFREIEDRWGLGLCLTNLGLIVAALGQHARATRLLRELMHRSLEIGDKFGSQYSFFGLACVADSEGRRARAARLWGMSEAIREAAGFRLPQAALSVMEYENRLTRARARLGEKTFEEAWAEGKAMPLKQAVEYALSDVESAPTATLPPERTSADEQSPALTRREEEVAVLVALGFTNREISAKLSISERTAGNHVASILKKLGLRSRAQFATWATEHSLLTPPHTD